MRIFFIHELELKNDRGAVETSFVLLIACFYNKMFYVELITSYFPTLELLTEWFFLLLVQPITFFGPLSKLE